MLILCERFWPWSTSGLVVSFFRWNRLWKHLELVSIGTCARKLHFMAEFEQPWEGALLLFGVEWFHVTSFD
jgi:hypothetical protein